MASFAIVFHKCKGGRVEGWKGEKVKQVENYWCMSLFRGFCLGKSDSAILLCVIARV